MSNTADVIDRDALVGSAFRLWKKARINAFAHKIASNRNKRFSQVLSFLSIITGIFSILSILFAYLFSQSVPPNGTEHQALIKLLTWILPHKVDAILIQVATLSFTISSIIFSVLSLIFTITAKFGEYASLSNEHEILQSLCLDISQKISPLKTNRSSINHNKFLDSLRELEENFRIIKMRGSEPSDADFKKAHYVYINRNKQTCYQYLKQKFIFCKKEANK
jgi:hypothetical protein